MSVATIEHAALAQDELQEELRHVRDLVFVRGLLAERGAEPAELHACDVTIAAARARLADTAKRESTRWATAA